MSESPRPSGHALSIGHARNNIARCRLHLGLVRAARYEGARAHLCGDQHLHGPAALRPDQQGHWARGERRQRVKYHRRPVMLPGALHAGGRSPGLRARATSALSDCWPCVSWLKEQFVRHRLIERVRSEGERRPRSTSLAMAADFILRSKKRPTSTALHNNSA